MGCGFLGLLHIYNYSRFAVFVIPVVIHTTLF